MTMTMTDFDYDYDNDLGPMTYDIWVHDNDSSIQELPECQSVDCCVRHTAEHQDAMPYRVHWPMKARALWLLHAGCRHKSNHVVVGDRARTSWRSMPSIPGDLDKPSFSSTHCHHISTETNVEATHPCQGPSLGGVAGASWTGSGNVCTVVGGGSKDKKSERFCKWNMVSSKVCKRKRCPCSRKGGMTVIAYRVAVLNSSSDVGTLNFICCDYLLPRTELFCPTWKKKMMSESCPPSFSWVCTCHALMWFAFCFHVCFCDVWFVFA